MEKKIFIRPQKGRKVPDLDGGYVPQDGAKVIFNAYWQRRLRDKDVVLVEASDGEKKVQEPLQAGVPHDNAASEEKKTATARKKTVKTASKKKDGEES